MTLNPVVLIAERYYIGKYRNGDSGKYGRILIKRQSFV